MKLKLGNLALRKERVRRERLAVVIPPRRQVRVCVRLNVGVDIIRRREIIRIATDIDRIGLLVDLEGGSVRRERT